MSGVSVLDRLLWRYEYGSVGEEDVRAAFAAERQRLSDAFLPLHGRTATIRQWNSTLLPTYDDGIGAVMGALIGRDYRLSRRGLNMAATALEGMQGVLAADDALGAAREADEHLQALVPRGPLAALPSATTPAALIAEAVAALASHQYAAAMRLSTEASRYAAVLLNREAATAPVRTHVEARCEHVRRLFADTAPFAPDPAADAELLEALPAILRFLQHEHVALGLRLLGELEILLAPRAQFGSFVAASPARRDSAGDGALQNAIRERSWHSGLDRLIGETLATSEREMTVQIKTLQGLVGAWNGEPDLRTAATQGTLAGAARRAHRSGARGGR